MSESQFNYCPHCGQPVIMKLVKMNEPERHYCSGCDTIHFQDPKLAAGVVLLYEGQIVLAKRAIEPGIGLWCYPGGFVERGETVQDAAKREVKEELNTDVHIDGLLGVYSYTGLNIAIVIYHGQAVSLRPSPGDEVTEVQFFPPKTTALPWNHLAFQSVKDSLKDYLSCHS